MSEETTFTPIGLSADLVLLNVVKSSSFIKNKKTGCNHDITVSTNDNKEASGHNPGKQLSMFG